MTAALVDSDILIEVARKREPMSAEWTRLTGSGTRLAVSAISVAELWHGARSNEETELQDMFRLVSRLPVDEQIAEVAGRLLRIYSRSHGLALADAIIAATAMTQHLPLWTRNARHFPMPELGFYRP